MKYSKPISASEAKYSIDSINNYIIPGGGGQASYNLPNDFLRDAKSKNVLVEDTSFKYSRKDKDGNAYVLAADYKLILGDGVLWLIGEEYKNKNNKFVGSIGYQNRKFQMYKAVYDKLNKDEYEWFVKLYNKNLRGNEFILDINENDKTLTIDVEFSAVNNSVEKNDIISESSSTYIDVDQKIEFPHNRIVFGAPGTGKSNRIENDKNVFNGKYERVTFHPNYSYSQFVGTYKPVPKGEAITYKYVPGPFMRTYVKAVDSIKKGNPKPYLLIIEEINRANVAAVFGDIFQLLDRKDGKSEYEIETSEDMKTYLANELGGSQEEYTRISIPSNMYIWATMNSADQGVFPMDTAFKRRWEFEYIGINENSEGIKDIMIKLGKGDKEHSVNWNCLRMAINDKLSKECKVNEDKLLGPYFLSKEIIETLEDSDFVEDDDKFIQAFKSKVIMYLYEDAAKQFKQKIFEGCDYSKYSSVCEMFEKIGVGIFGESMKSEILDMDRE